MLLSPIEVARFAAKTQWHGGCLVWTARKNSDGYGIVTVRRRQWKAHRLAYTDAWGEIPTGMVVRHKCDNPACVNPSHLQLGTDADNAKDKAIRRRVPVKLSEDQVRLIRSDARTMREIGNKYGVSASLICLIKSGERRQHVGG